MSIEEELRGRITLDRQDKEIVSKFSFQYDTEEELEKLRLAVRALTAYINAANARIFGNPSEADCLYAEAQAIWQRLEEATAILHKPQPPSGGSYGGIEI